MQLQYNFYTKTHDTSEFLPLFSFQENFLIKDLCECKDLVEFTMPLRHRIAYIDQGTNILHCDKSVFSFFDCLWSRHIPLRTLCSDFAVSGDEV